MFLQLQTRLTAGGLPRVTDMTDKILALPGLLTWFAPQASTVTLDSAGRVSEWRSLMPRGGALRARVGANRPEWALSAAAGRSGLSFLGARSDVLDWSGVLPNGAGTQFSAFVIAALPASSSFSYICGADITSTPSRNILAYNNTALRGIVDGSTAAADVGTSGDLFAPDGGVRLVGYGHSDAANLLAVYGREEVVSVANAAVIAQGAFSLGHTAIADRQPTMTVFDVLLFDTQVITTAPNTLATLQAYADSYVAG